MAEAYKRAGLIGPLQQNLPASGPTTILLRNDSGGAVPQYGILGIGDPLHLWDGDDAALQAEFLRNPRAFKGLLPTSAHENRYALAMQAIPKDQIGACALRGVYPCILNMTDASHKQASPTVGDVTKMTSDDCGFADIVWVESGTGDKHALVAVRPFTMVCATPATCADFVRLNPLDMVMTLSGINGNCPGCPWPMDIDGTYSEARPPYGPGWVHSGDPSFGAFAYPYYPPYPGLAIILWFECQVSKVRVEINKFCPDLGFMATWAECQLSEVTISSGRLEFVATVNGGACTAGIATFSAAII
jgi:hypothetical protein